MKTPIEKLTETNAAQAAEILALNAKIKAMEEDKDDPPEETEEEKKKREEEEDAARKAAEEEEKKDDGKALKSLGDQVKALSAFIKSPEFRASIVPGSASGVPEGGSASGSKTMTEAEALAAYNKIDPNDAKARAQFRADHKTELGL